MRSSTGIDVLRRFPLLAEINQSSCRRGIGDNEHPQKSLGSVPGSGVPERWLNKGRCDRAAIAPLERLIPLARDLCAKRPWYCSDGAPLRRATGRHRGWIAENRHNPAPKSRPGVGPILYSVTLPLSPFLLPLPISPSLSLCRDDRPRRTADLPQRPPTRRICIRVSVPLSRAPSPSRPPSFPSRSLALPTSYPAYHLPASRPSATPFSFVPPLLFCPAHPAPCCVSGNSSRTPVRGQHRRILV